MKKGNKPKSVDTKNVKGQKRSRTSRKEKAVALIPIPATVPTYEEIEELALKRIYMAIQVEYDPSKIAKTLEGLEKYAALKMERNKVDDVDSKSLITRRLTLQIQEVLSKNGFTHDTEEFEVVK